MRLSTLSIIVPVYNEEKTLKEIIEKVQKVKLRNIKKEIIIINSGSTDESQKIIDVLKRKYRNIISFRHKKKEGKGAAVKTGLKHCSGDVIIIQDADLEYKPEDYHKLISPIINERAEVVYGSRTLKKNKHSSFAYYAGGLLVTFVTNLLYGTRITDEPTGYKVFRKEVIENINIKSNGFEWEPEITAKIAKKGIKIHEVPISYYPRTCKDGKKINYFDGLKAIWTLIKLKFRNN